MALPAVVGPRLRDAQTVAFQNTRKKCGVIWFDDHGDDSEWYKSAIARTDHGRLAIGKLFALFVRAYLVAVTAAAAGSSPRSQKARLMLEHMATCQRNGRPTNAVVIDTFEMCPGSIFYDTLSLLYWAGHACKDTSMQGFKYAVTHAVNTYFEALTEEGDLEELVVKQV